MQLLFWKGINIATKGDSNLKVPLAYDYARQVVKPEQAVRGERYHCVSCLQEVIVRGTSRVRTHFAHVSDPDVCDFLHETEEHWQAKQQLIHIVQSQAPITFMRRCDSCRAESEQVFLTGGCTAIPEYVLSTGHRTDVALVHSDGSLALAMEVLATHEVPPEKAVLLRELPWVELHAGDVLRASFPIPKFFPIRPDRSSFTCTSCEERKSFSRILPFVGHTLQFVSCPLPSAGKVHAVEVCARCDHFKGASNKGISCLGLRAVDATI